MEPGMDEVIKKFDSVAPNAKETFNIEKAIAKAKEKKDSTPWYVERSTKKNVEVALVLNVNSNDLAKQITVLCTLFAIHCVLVGQHTVVQR